ncbi:MAG: hypothetical protein ACTSWC_06500 [Promethearchaeota archaeon]
MITAQNPPHSPKIQFLNRIEPVKYHNELYGQAIRFNVNKQNIQFLSQFHAPAYIQFNQIEKVKIQFNTKRKMLWWGLATILFFVGILILYIRVKVPNWKIEIFLKKERKPVVIRAWMNDIEGIRLANLLSPHITVEYYPKKALQHLNEHPK